MRQFYGSERSELEEQGTIVPTRTTEYDQLCDQIMVASSAAAARLNNHRRAWKGGVYADAFARYADRRWLWQPRRIITKSVSLYPLKTAFLQLWLEGDGVLYTFDHDLGCYVHVLPKQLGMNNEALGELLAELKRIAT